MDKPLKEALKGHVSDIFNKVYRGQTLSTAELEHLDLVTSRLARDILRAVEVTTLEKARKLNDATKLGFKLVGQDMETLFKEGQDRKNEVRDLTAKVDKLHDAVHKLIDEVNKRPVSAMPPLARPSHGPREGGYTPQPRRGTPAQENSDEEA